MDLRRLMENPSELNAETLPELRALVERYPFFQVARLLYIANLYRTRSKDFGPELRRASVYVPDRTALFALTEGEHYEWPAREDGTSAIQTEGDENRTMSLIDSFLAGGIETDDGGTGRHNMPSVADLTNDYASFLVQQETTRTGGDGAERTGEAPQLKGAELIDSFIAETSGKQRLEMPEVDGDEEFVSPELSGEDEEIYTESMVNIYIKQGRYEQALEILRKICLNNPKKSHNFATQMNLLEILLKEKEK